ncbi:serine/threonine protein kinase [Fusarium austroafricanum]|uniref:Serine/threonine protein kinase n=1 Tax=Fusarium austroafricanum TaxID=2364996 RepID=A0A8H4KQ34_9HYPO|nr:serine/threonine protein kinase [Fusarium austroafricanum]
MYDSLAIISVTLNATNMLKAMTTAYSQVLHERMDAAHNEYLRMSRVLDELINRQHLLVSEAGTIATSDFLIETLNSIREESNNMRLGIERARAEAATLENQIRCYRADSISSRVATRGKLRRLLDSSGEIEAKRTVEDLSESTRIIVVCANFDVFERFVLSTTPTSSPFYDFGNSNRPLFDEMEAFKSGGSAEVYSAIINPCNDHHGLIRGQSRRYAVKRLYSDRFEDFCRERDAYEKLGLAKDPHQHIVPLLASYRMEGKYHLIFPYAECDLAMYLRLNSEFKTGKEGIQWFGSQMKGLADALSTVHGSKWTEGQSMFHGVHGDIKPENILCFGGDGQSTSFALTDFGSSYFLHPEHPKSIDTRRLKHTPVYRAPEVHTTSEGVTQAYDIWSLGCVFSEALAWFIGGRAGLASLRQARLDLEDDSPNCDAFFRLKYEKGGGRTAQLKPQVHGFLLSLCHVPRCGPFMEDLLHLVLNGMLKVDMHARMTSREVCDTLSEMCKRLECDLSYSEPRGSADAEMAPSHTPYFSARSTPLTKSKCQVHTNQNVSNYLTSTTQDFEDADNQTTKPPFACPFHKAGILVSALHRACQGPGWTSISKLKQHLIRAHLPNKDKGKHICGRCDSSFETGSLLLAHQKQEPPCRSKKSQSTYGMITSEQAALLKSVRRKSNKVTDEERWFEIYRIIFPSYKRTDNISPYHESHYESTSLSTLNSTTTSSNGISQYKDYLRKRDVEEYAAKLAGRGITLPLEVVAQLLEVQVRDIETFDETMREPVRAYEIPASFSHEKMDTESSVPTQGRALGSSDVLGQFQLLPRLDNSEEY